MNYLESNKKAIRAGFPELYDRIPQRAWVSPDAYRDISDDRISDIEEKNSKYSDISAVVLNTADGGRIRLNSEYDPVHEAKIWTEGQDETVCEYSLIFGLGNGVFARELICSIKDKPVLIYEPSARLFIWALSRYDLRDFFTPSVHVIVEGINEDLFMGVMETMITYENYEDYHIYMLPHMDKIFPDSREKFIKHFAADGIGWIEGNITTEREELYISPKNLLHNIKYLEEGTVVPKFAYTIPKDVPILLVGAAPSLATEIETIKKYREDVYIFAADMVCAYLLENGIVPDAFISVEADKPLELYRDGGIIDIPIFTKVNTSHKLLSWHRSKKIFGYDDNEFIQEYYKKHHIPMSQYRYGGNTMTALFAICDEMGMETVMLVGQDMCFDSDGNTHVDDSRSDKIDESGDFVCENNEGKIVKTRYDWFTFLRWYESAIYDCSMKRVINTSLKGAKVSGTIVMPLEDAIKKYGKKHKSFSEVVDSTEKAYGRGAVPNLQDVYRRLDEELDEIKSIVTSNPRDDKRKEKMVYGILKKYEMVNEKNDLLASQIDGIEKIHGFLVELSGE